MSKITVLKKGLDWLDDIRREKETERDTILRGGTRQGHPDDEDPDEFHGSILQTMNLLGISGKNTLRHTSAHPAIRLETNPETSQGQSPAPPMSSHIYISSFRELSKLTDEKRPESQAQPVLKHLRGLSSQRVLQRMDAHSATLKTLVRNASNVPRTRDSPNAISFPDTQSRSLNHNLRSTATHQRIFQETEIPTQMTDYAMFDSFLNDKEFNKLKSNTHLNKKICKLKQTVELKKDYISKVRKRESYLNSITNNILNTVNTTLLSSTPEPSNYDQTSYPKMIKNTAKDTKNTAKDTKNTVKKNLSS
jgi:hypothetical protein